MKLLIGIGSFVVCMGLGLLIAELTSFFPMLIVFYVFFIISTVYLCKMWDNYVIVRMAKKLGVSPFEYIKDRLPEYILHHCGVFRGDEKALKKFLRHCVSRELLNKACSDIVFEEYKTPISKESAVQNVERQNPENTYRNYR